MAGSNSRFYGYSSPRIQRFWETLCSGKCLSRNIITSSAKCNLGSRLTESGTDTRPNASYKRQNVRDHSGYENASTSNSGPSYNIDPSTHRVMLLLGMLREARTTLSMRVNAATKEVSEVEDEGFTVAMKRKMTAEPQNITEASVQARFCRAVTKLQITGLLRTPSKRCPDFVQRVTFMY
ncbi:origin of replication complex subunit 3 isoform X1 [Tanacetum coccineum]|uniref:Origin of replication complex subunit 3 isoform X1 n=1 Tax=Tanacetum coccineum TaxID=301880 RepID=A0ABQ5CFS0_9ASTR